MHKKTPWRVLVTGLPEGTEWKHLKDHCVASGVGSVMYANARNADGGALGLLEFPSEDAGDRASMACTWVPRATGSGVADETPLSAVKERFSHIFIWTSLRALG